MKINKYLSHTLMLASAVVAMCLSSCGSSGYETIEDKVKGLCDDNTTMIMTIDMKRGFEALDITTNSDGQIELPSQVSSLLNNALSPSEKQGMQQFLDFKGIDWTNTVMAFHFEGLDKGNPSMEGMLIFSVTNEDDLSKSVVELSEGQFTTGSVSGYKTLEANGSAILLKDKTGFLVFTAKGVPAPDQAADIIEKWKTNAKETPMADWKVKYLTENKVGTFLMSLEPFINMARMASGRSGAAVFNNIPASVQTGYYGMTGDVQGSTISMSAVCLDKDGKKVEVQGLGKCDPDLIKYANSSDWLVAMAGLGDLTQLKDILLSQAGNDPEVVEICNQWLPKLNNASLMFAIGPRNFEAFSGENPSDWHAVLAVRFSSPAIASEFFQLVAGQNGAQGQTEFTTTVPAGGYYNDNYDYVPVYMKLNGKLDGSVIVISNSDITTAGGCTISADNFAGKALSVVLNIEKNDPLLKQFSLPIGINAKITSEGAEANGELTLTGTDKKLVPALMDVLMSAAAQ